MGKDNKQIVLKFKGIVNSPPKLYNTEFGKHFSFAVKLEQSIDDVFSALTTKLADGVPEDEEWIRKEITTSKLVIIIKLPLKGLEFKAKITGTKIDPFNLAGPNTNVGDKVTVTVKLGCWFMRNETCKYGVSASASDIHFGETVIPKRKKADENDEILVDSDKILVDSDNESIVDAPKKKKSHNKADRDVLKSMNDV